MKRNGLDPCWLTDSSVCVCVCSHAQGNCADLHWITLLIALHYIFVSFRGNFMLHSAGIEVSHESFGCFKILRGMKKRCSHIFSVFLSHPLFPQVCWKHPIWVRVLRMTFNSFLYTQARGRTHTLTWAALTDSCSEFTQKWCHVPREVGVLWHIWSVRLKNELYMCVYCVKEKKTGDWLVFSGHVCFS